LKQEGRRSMSTVAIKACRKHFFVSFLLPIIICSAIALLLHYLLGTHPIEITSPQAALGNISNFVSMILGFLFTFLSIILGSSGTPTIKNILSFPATCFQFWCTLLAPMIFGLCAWSYTTYLSAMLPDEKTICIISVMLPYCSSLLAFLISFPSSSILYIRVINKTAK